MANLKKIIGKLWRWTIFAEFVWESDLVCLPSWILACLSKLLIDSLNLNHTFQPLFPSLPLLHPNYIQHCMNMKNFQVISLEITEICQQDMRNIALYVKTDNNQYGRHENGSKTCHKKQWPNITSRTRTTCNETKTPSKVHSLLHYYRTMNKLYLPFLHCSALASVFLLLVGSVLFSFPICRLLLPGRFCPGKHSFLLLTCFGWKRIVANQIAEKMRRLHYTRWDALLDEKNTQLESEENAWLESGLQCDCFLCQSNEEASEWALDYTCLLE